MADKPRPKVVDVVEVKRHSGPLMIPDTITTQQAIDVLKYRLVAEESPVVITEQIDTYPLNGALAFAKALDKACGMFMGIPTQSFFGDNPPEMRSIDVGLNQTRLAPWGQVAAPGIEGTFHLGVGKKDGRAVFQVTAEVKKKYEEAVRELVSLARQIAHEENIYRGKSIALQFTDDKGQALGEKSPWTGEVVEMPAIRFLDLSKVDESALVLNDDIYNRVHDKVFKLLEHTDAYKAAGVPMKRGALFAGQPGTGKTLAGQIAAAKAVKHGWTVVLVTKAEDTVRGLRFGTQLGKTLIFVEDIDRVAGGNRTTKVDELLNTLDGIDTKGAEFYAIFTTNAPEAIEKTAIRTGRTDTIIFFELPDPKAVENLIRRYGQGMIDPNADLTKVGKELAGEKPADIREALEEAKCTHIALHVDEPDFNPLRIQLTGEDLYRAAVNMRPQREFAKEKQLIELTPEERMGKALGEQVGAALAGVAEAASRSNGVLELAKQFLFEMDDDDELESQRQYAMSKREPVAYVPAPEEPKLAD